jgi:glycosyltransferase involved in cell wall biosynthesis
MLANFLNSPKIREEFDVTFAFRMSDIYLTGLNRRVNNLNKIELIPLAVVDPNSIINYIASRYGNLCSKFIISIALLTGAFAIIDLYNALVLYLKLFRNRTFDVIHINNGGFPGARSTLAAAMVAHLTNQGPVIYVVNNMAARLTIINALISGWWFVSAKLFVTKFVTASKIAANSLKDSLKLKSTHFESIHNGIDPRNGDQSRLESRASLNLSADTIAFGIVAILEPRKGHRYAIEAISLLGDTDKNMNIKLLIEGDGPSAVELRNLVKKLQLENKIHFIGRHPHISNFYAGLDVLVLPSIANEDFPNVILEGMHHKLPIIGTKIAGIPEQIDDNLTGFIVEPANSKALAEKMEILINNEAMRSNMSEESQIKFKKKFQSKFAVGEYVKLYSDLLG